MIASGADAIVGTSYSSTLFSGTGAVSAETQLSWRVMIAIIVQAKNRVTVMISDSPHHWGLLWKIRGLLSSVGRNFRNSIDYSKGSLSNRSRIQNRRRDRTLRQQ